MLPRWQSWRPSGVTPSTSPRSKKKRRSGKRSRKWGDRRLPGKATLRAALAPAVAFRLAATFRPAAAGPAAADPAELAVADDPAEPRKSFVRTCGPRTPLRGPPFWLGPSY